MLWLQSCIDFENLLPTLSFSEAFSFLVNDFAKQVLKLTVKCPYLQLKHLYWAPEQDIQLPAQHFHLNVLEASQSFKIYIYIKYKRVLSLNLFSCLLCSIRAKHHNLSNVHTDVWHHPHLSNTISSRLLQLPTGFPVTIFVLYTLMFTHEPEWFLKMLI